MEMTFGCRVNIRKGKKGYWGDSKIGKGTVIATFLGEKISHSGYDPVDDNISAILDNGTVRTTFSCSKNGVEIIGHPIRLSHVLRAIAETNSAATANVFGYIQVVSPNVSSNGLTIEWKGCGWNLTQDDLSLQSLETIDFLFKILCE